MSFTSTKPQPRWQSLALDGVALHQARHDLLRHYRGVDPKQLTRELTAVYEMVDHLREDVGACPTCAIAPLVSFKPVFSMPVSAPYQSRYSVDLRLQ